MGAQWAIWRRKSSGASRGSLHKGASLRGEKARSAA